MFEDWRSYVRTEAAVKDRFKVLEIPPASRITEKVRTFHNQTNKIEFDIRDWYRSESIEFRLFSMGWRLLNTLDFVNEPNDSGGRIRSGDN
jgi:hypothetical protein